MAIGHDATGTSPHPSRTWWRRLCGLLVAVLVVVACSADPGSDAATGDRRADQVRKAALDAGLDASIAEFLASAARGATATSRVRYPGPTPGTELVVVTRPPDRRVDVVADGIVTETRLVVDGVALDCGPDTGLERGRCTRTDAFVEPPGVFRPAALADLVDALAAGAEAFTYALDTREIAGVTADCLETTSRPRAEVEVSGTLCIAADGTVLSVVRAGERLEALEYDTDVSDADFERPDGDGA